MLAIFTQTRMHNTTALYYPLGTVPRAYGGIEGRKNNNKGIENKKI
jgi:hypothetical protein